MFSNPVRHVSDLHDTVAENFWAGVAVVWLLSVFHVNDDRPSFLGARAPSTISLPAAPNIEQEAYR